MKRTRDALFSLDHDLPIPFEGHGHISDVSYRFVNHSRREYTRAINPGSHSHRLIAITCTSKIVSENVGRLRNGGWCSIKLNRTRSRAQVHFRNRECIKDCIRNNKSSSRKRIVLRYELNYSREIARTLESSVQFLRPIFDASSARSIDEGIYIFCAMILAGTIAMMKWELQRLCGYIAWGILPVSERIKPGAYDYVMLSSRYIRLPGTHNGASPCSIKSYADLGATMERGRSNRHAKKVASRIPRRFLDQKRDRAMRCGRRGISMALYTRRYWSRSEAHEY